LGVNLNRFDYDKIFVLDTNVILHSAESIYSFQNNLVVIPLAVIEELDTFKKEQDETGRNSRQFSRFMDKLREKGKISEGVPLGDSPKSGYLKVDMGRDAHSYMKDLFDKKSVDNIILATSIQYASKYKLKTVVLVSKDINLRIKADVFNIASEDYIHDSICYEDLYTGIMVKKVSSNIIDILYEKKEITKEDWKTMPKLLANQYIVLKNGKSHRGVARYDKKNKKLVPLKSPKSDGVLGIFPKNLEQQIAFDLLLNDDIKLVSLVGKAGTGKTLLAVAAGLSKSLEEVPQVYKKLIVSRPIVPMGKDLGYLPGDVSEKMGPWMKPIVDSMDFLLQDDKSKDSMDTESLMTQGLVEIEPLTYIRGRSIPNQYIILDESQNLTPHEMKTIITRVGEGTKIVLTGDHYQIDNPFLDATSNGLSYVVDKFKDIELAGHITLIKGERSELADIASNIL